METRGMAKAEEESEEGFYNSPTDLCERAESQLSRIAWNDREHKIPLLTLKWLSPNHERFSSRKSAEEEAEKLTEQQLFVDKIVFGYGARGQKLQPRKPMKQEALKAGKWRFLRDGIWVVGQEESWQNDRSIEIERETKRRKLQSDQKVTQPKPVPSGPKSALQLFVKTQRSRYREVMQETLLTILDNSRFTLTEADRELREIWKTNMTIEERQLWKDLLKKKTSADGFSSNPVSSERDSIETQERDLTDVKGAKEHSGTGALHPNEQNLHLQAAYASNLLTGIGLSKREDDEGIIRCEDASAVHDGGLKTADSLPAGLRQQWNELGSAATEQWEERATSEHTELVKVVVVSPGDSEEEIEENTRKGSCSKHAKMCPGEPGSFAAPSAGDKIGAEDDVLSDANADGSQNDINPVGSNASHERSAAVRRSGRPQKAKCIFEVEIRKKQSKEMAPHVPSAWAIPVVQERGVDSQMIVKPATDETAPFQLPASETLTASKRKRPEHPSSRIIPSEHWKLAHEQIQMCYDAAMEHFDKVMYTVKARALFAELSDGFDVLRERGRGRYDMELPAFDEPRFQFLTDFSKTPWMGVVRQILGEDVVLIHKGVFLSNPGADAQEYHQDGPHLTTQYQRPCHAINVFVPLVDLCLRNGPTEFVVGSHILDYDDYDRNKVVTPQVAAGTPIIFDYRLGHRGRANMSDACRPIVYCTYAAASNGKEFRDSVNFSRKRYHRLGEMIEKPLSREERRKIREAFQEQRDSLKPAEGIDATSAGCNPSKNSEVAHEERKGLDRVEEADASTVRSKSSAPEGGSHEKRDDLKLVEEIVAATFGSKPSESASTNHAHSLSPATSPFPPTSIT